MTLLELLVVMALASLMLTVSFALSIPMLAREKTRGALRDVQVFVQLARSEAVTRNRAMRFVIDPAASTLFVYDTRGTTDTGDDLALHRRVLPKSVGFARPDSGSPINLAAAPNSTYQTVFESSGAVSQGAGGVYLYGGQHYVSLVVFGAGGTRITQWKNGTWEQGS